MNLLKQLKWTKTLGYADWGQLEREELEIDNLEDVIDELYDVIQPLYVELYSFVRGRLAASDVDVKPELPLPAHILGPLDLHVIIYHICLILMW